MPKAAIVVHSRLGPEEVLPSRGAFLITKPQALPVSLA